MEEKKILITEKAENQILGQESVFGWEMKEKINTGKFLSFKYCLYTLVRDRNEEDVTQAHRDAENKWNNEFKVWNNFILYSFKKLIIAEIIVYLMIFAGIVVMFAGIPLMSHNSTLFIVGLIITLLSFAISIPCLVIVNKNAAKRLKKMDEISRAARQVNSASKK